MQQTVKLKDTYVEYDSKTGKLFLKSNDPRIKGKPFKLSLRKFTNVYETLHKMIIEETCKSTDKLPKSLRVKTPDILLANGLDPRTSLVIGQGFDNNPVILDFEETHNYLVYGKSGSGKTVLTNTIQYYALHQELIELNVINLNPYDQDSISIYRSSDKVARNIDEASKMIIGLSETIKTRYKVMREMNYQAHFLDLSFNENSKSIFLMIDNIDLLDKALLTDYDSKNNSNLSEAEIMETKAALNFVYRFGGAAGVFTVSSSRKINHRYENKDIKGRITVGITNEEEQRKVHFKLLDISEKFLKPRGRAAHDVIGSKTIPFQIFFTPRELLTK